MMGSFVRFAVFINLAVTASTPQEYIFRPENQVTYQNVSIFIPMRLHC